MPQTHIIIFSILAAGAVLSALLMVTGKNPIHSILYLVATFFCISGHYILLNAQFLAIANIIIYAGAIMVLFLFVVMLMNLNKSTEFAKKISVKIVGYLLGIIFLVSFCILILKSSEPLQENISINSGKIGLVNNLGTVLFNEYTLPFELTSLLFLTAVLAGVLLARKAKN